MLKYVTTNFQNIMLVNKFYYQNISDENNYQKYWKDKIDKIIELFKSASDKGIKISSWKYSFNVLNIKLDYCMSMIKDKDYIDNYLDYESTYSIRKESGFLLIIHRLGMKYSKKYIHKVLHTKTNFKYKFYDDTQLNLTI